MLDSTALRAALSEYDSIVCIDRSGSMANKAPGFDSRWLQAQEITTGLAGFAAQVDDDGITVVQFGGTFVKSRDLLDGVKLDAVTDVFVNHTPGGGTPLAEALQAAFDKKFASSKKAIVFVITDGIPDDPGRVQSVIKAAASRISDPSQIRVLFLQVGDDHGASKYLDDLDEHLDGAKFDIVNAIGFADANKLSPEELFQRAIDDSH